MPFHPARFFRNFRNENSQAATDAIEEGFRNVETDSVQFNTASSEISAIGKMVWDATDGTVGLGLDGGVVVAEIAESLFVRVYNGTADAFTRGQVVKLDGSQGTRLSVSLAQANSEAGSSKTFGVVAEPIAKNTSGFVMTSGHLRDLNTNAMTEGALIWLDPVTAGGMTTTKPSAPDHLVLVGQCVKKAGGAGIVFVHIQNGYELDELHNVAISNPLDGQSLKYEASSGLWKNKA